MKIFKIYATMIDFGEEVSTIGVFIANDENSAKEEFMNRWGWKEKFTIRDVEKVNAIMIGPMKIL